MQSGFETCLKVTLAYEGGYSDAAHDPGGKTMRGVTQRVYNGWRKLHGQPLQWVKLISDAEVQAIYRENYWEPCRGNSLPAGPDLCNFDGSVNSGWHRAAKWLQRAVNKVLGRKALKVDGLIGPATLAAVRQCDSIALVNAMCDQRMGFLRHLGIFRFFGRGWTRRVEGVRDVAKHMALAARAKPANDNQVIMAKAA